jgi:outer membrane protein TolC
MKYKLMTRGLPLQLAGSLVWKEDFFRHGRTVLISVMWMMVMILGTGSMGYAQELPEKELIYLDLSRDIQEQLPPLQVLLERAAANHPSVKFNSELAKAYASRIDVERKSWTSHINGFFNYGYGNQQLIAAGSIESDFVNIANGYRTGINLNVPLYEFVTRKDRLKQRKFEYDAQLYKKDELALEVHNHVVEQYHTLILSQKLMNLRMEMVEKARQSMNISEQEFKVGNIDVATYTRMIEIYTINSSQYEMARMEFMKAYDKMELLIGDSIVNILNEEAIEGE